MRLYEDGSPTKENREFKYFDDGKGPCQAEVTIRQLMMHEKEVSSESTHSFDKLQ